MKKIIIVFIAIAAACTSRGNTAEQSAVKIPENSASAAAPAQKWKADETTKINVARLAGILNDSAYSRSTTRTQLFTRLRAGIDTLVKECRMTGKDHDALHGWLEKFMKHTRELKEEHEDYHKILADLRKDIDKFYVMFE